MIDPSESLDAAAFKFTSSGAVPDVGIAANEAVGGLLPVPPPPPPPPQAARANVAARASSPGHRDGNMGCANPSARRFTGYPAKEKGTKRRISWRPPPPPAPSPATRGRGSATAGVRANSSAVPAPSAGGIPTRAAILRSSQDRRTAASIREPVLSVRQLPPATADHRPDAGSRSRSAASHH